MKNNLLIKTGGGMAGWLIPGWSIYTLFRKYSVFSLNFGFFLREIFKLFFEIFDSFQPLIKLIIIFFQLWNPIRQLQLTIWHFLFHLFQILICLILLFFNEHFHDFTFRFDCKLESFQLIGWGRELWINGLVLRFEGGLQFWQLQF